MADWNAELYLRFAEERTRPARELLGGVRTADVANAVDIGCGPGNSTELIAERFPSASLLGLDTSPDMLSAARKRLPLARFEEGNVSTFQADLPADLIFANAVLQWVPAHETLFPALLGQLAPGGTLAVQMPDNLDQPSHRAMRQTAAEGPWATILGDAEAIRTRILSSETYYDLLAPLAVEVDLWRTTYSHVLADAEAIVEWVRATGLRAFLDPLDDDMQAGFLAAYTERIRAAYPRRADGRVLLHFPRLFIVARR